MNDDEWWLHVYVMLSRATCMEDMLLLRPPPREKRECGPPKSVRLALQRVEALIEESTEAAARVAASIGIELPE